jgi:hypothetical protein
MAEWVVDSGGMRRRLFRLGEVQIGGKTVESFAWLKDAAGGGLDSVPGGHSGIGLILAPVGSDPGLIRFFLIRFFLGRGLNLIKIPPLLSQTS